MDDMWEFLNSTNSKSSSEIIEIEDDWFLIENEIQSNELIIIPEDVLKVIFSYLNAKDLAHILHVCRRWKRIAESSILWFNLIKKEYPKDLLQLLHGKSFSTIETLEKYIETQQNLNELLSFYPNWRLKYSTIAWRNIPSRFPKDTNEVCVVLDNDKFVSSTPNTFLTGRVLIQIVNKPLELFDLNLQFTGYEKAPQLVVDTLDLVTHPYFSIKLNLWTRKVLQVGIHSFPFSIKIPIFGDSGEMMPASFLYPPFVINYELSAHCSYEGLFSRCSLNFVCPIIFSTHFDVPYEMKKSSQVSQTCQSKRLFGGILGFKAELERDIFVVGSTINFRLNIVNECGKDLKEICMNLIEVVTPKGLENQIRKRKIGYVSIPYHLPSKSRGNFSCSYLIPHNTRPSIKYAKLFTFSYQFEIKLHTTSSLIDFDTPIIIIPIDILGKT